jgi:hypothetical protein
MKRFPWIFAGIGIGIAAASLLYTEDPKPIDPTADDGFTDLARKTFAWGTGQQSPDDLAPSHAT